MNGIDASIARPSQPGWEILFQLSLTDSIGFERALAEGLSRLVEQYNLPSTLVERVTTSSREALSRAFEPYPSQTDFHVNLNIYVQAAAKLRSQANPSWGFFRIEKIGPAPEVRGLGENVIEFFLYLEE